MSTQQWEYFISLVENATIERTNTPAIYNTKITVELDAYEASNLLYHLKQIWTGKLPCSNGGDWYGQIPSQLERKMKEAGGTFLTYKANGNNQTNDPFAWP